MLLVPRPLKIIIGTIDYSDCIASYDGGDEKLGYSGLVVFRGKMVIGRALGFDTLDDRKNKLWNRGTPVKIYISDDSQTVRPSPRGGSLFVLSSAYSFDERTLTIEVGDSIALLSNREGKGDRTNICLGTPVSKTAIINRLLAASGAPPLIDTVPGILYSPHPKLVTGSYIEQAGIIAAGSGYFLFMDSLNQTRASSIEIGLGTPIVTVDLINKASNYKRITGENPAAWFVVNTNLESTDSSQYGFESTSESYGPLAIAGVPLFGTIIIRSEWQKESLSGNKRFVQTKVWEPIGAIIPLRKGQANKILSYDKLEIFEYESSASTSGTSASDICQSGNQGRLKRRTLTVSRPLGTVLDKVIQTAPTEFQPGYLENPILALREVEEFDYGVAQTITIVNTLPPVPGAPALSPNDIPPTDPSTARPQLTAGLRHTLSRFEPAGAIAPEDFEWTSTFALWIAAASTHAQSYELIKEWTEARSEEWIAVERERVSFNRATPEAAAENRDLIQSSQATANSYPRDLFCALQMVRNDRKVSSSGNTHPPAPDTIPSAYALKSTPKSYKYKMPIDTDFPFRPKTQEVTIEYLTIDGTLLAEKLGKISWGRFKGLSIQAEFSQDWWAYTPMCRVNVLEPSIGLTGDTINTSAYLGDSWAISMSDGECAIGMDGIFLGFIKNNILIPPYVEVSIVDVVSTSVATIRSVTVIDTTPIISRTSLTSTMVSTLISILPQLTYITVTQLSNTIQDDPVTLSSGDAILNAITGYREAYKLEASWSGPINNISTLSPYEVQIRKNGGAWSTAVFVPTDARAYFRTETLTAEIPGIVFLSSSATPYGYVGPGSYDLKVKSTVAATGSYSYTLISVRFPSPYASVSIADLNNGNAIVVSQTLPVTATINAITSITPVIAVKAGFPGYTAAATINWTEDGPGSIIGTGPLTASFTSGALPYIDADSALLDPRNKESAITATIDGYPSIFKTITVRSNQAELANTSTYAITGIQLLGPNNEANSITVFADDLVSIGSILQGTGNFPTSLNLSWSVVSGPGQIIQELYLPGKTGEHIVFLPSQGTTQIRATAANGISADFSIIRRVVSAVSIAFNVVSGQTFEAGSTFSVTATVTSTQASFNSAVNWQQSVSTNSNNLTQSVNGNVLTINVLSGDFVGEIASFTATSVQDPAVIVQFDIFTISKVTGIAIVASKSSMGANETASVQGYFAGIGRLTGLSTIGTQSFSWAISGPATLVNTIGTFATLTSTAATGTIGLAASVQGRSFVGNASINNTGVVATPTGLTALTAGTITYTGSQTVYFPMTFANLNDAGNTTGIVVGVGSGPVTVGINLGAVKLIGQMKMGGGTLGTPWNNTTSNYLNLGLIEYSLNNVAWTKYAIVSGTTDNLGEFKTYLPDVYAMYWRITRDGWVGMATWAFSSRPIPPSPTSMVVAGLTWTLTYWDSGQSIQYGSLVEAAIVYVSIAFTATITSANTDCSHPTSLVMRDALIATLGANAGWGSNSSCYVGAGAINNMAGVVRIFTKR